MKKTEKQLLCFLLMISMLSAVLLFAPAAGASEAPSEEQTSEAPTSQETQSGEISQEPASQDPRALLKRPLFTTVPVSADGEEPEKNNVTELGKVTGIRTTSDSSDHITLSWSALDGASGYNIYYKSLNNKNARLNLLTSVKSTSVTLHNVSAGTKWHFEICGYGISKGNVFEGEISVYETGSKPQMVTNFELVASGSVINLHWKLPERADGYIMYREDASTNGGYKEVKRLPDSATSFSDTNTSAGQVYTYRIQAYIKIGSTVIGGPFNQMRAMKGLCSPGNNGSETLLSKVHLRWHDNDYASGYEIQVSTDNKNFSTYTTTSGTCCHSGRYNTGSTVCFRIIPYGYGRGYKVWGTYTQVNMTISGGAFGESVGSSFVEICIEDQYMWYYKNGRFIEGTPVVTGNYGDMDTPKGYHSVNSKASPCTLVGANYVTTVNYWMAFIGSGYGIHDATWRSDSEFGGNTYKGNGSHGCVNTPYNAVKNIYQNMTIGTPVIVY